MVAGRESKTLWGRRGKDLGARCEKVGDDTFNRVPVNQALKVLTVLREIQSSLGDISLNVMA